VLVLDTNIKLYPSAGRELRGNCPFCGDKKGHLYVNIDKGVFYCHKCGASGIFGQKRNNVANTAKVVRKAVDIKIKLDTVKLNKVYRELILHLSLSKEHFRHLTEERKLAPTKIKEKEYRTLPLYSREKIAAKIASDIKGIPGFYKKDGMWSIAGPKGLLIPFRNFNNEIWGMQIRPDDDFMDCKYCWLSSNGKPEGTKANTVYHVAGSNKTRRVWITEGPLKGDIASYITGETFICVPGVNSWGKAEVVEDLSEQNIKEAIICYDADAVINIHVARAAVKLYDALERNGIKTYFAYWELEKGKGIDDMLCNGYEPEIISAENWKKAINYQENTKNRERRGKMNNIILAGRIINKPSVKDIQRKDGSTVKRATFTVLCERNGQKDYIPVNAWGNTAEKASTLEKNQFVVVNGFLRTVKAYDDYGSQVSMLQVNASDFNVINTTEEANNKNGQELTEEVPF
jgi:ribosomal protein L37AE/L43A